MMASNSDILVA
jgi:hypothetical protein